MKWSVPGTEHEARQDLLVAGCCQDRVYVKGEVSPVQLLVLTHLALRPQNLPRLIKTASVGWAGGGGGSGGGGGYI